MTGRTSSNDSRIDEAALDESEPVLPKANGCIVGPAGGAVVGAGVGDGEIGRGGNESGLGVPTSASAFDVISDEVGAKLRLGSSNAAVGGRGLGDGGRELCDMAVIR